MRAPDGAGDSHEHAAAETTLRPEGDLVRMRRAKRRIGRRDGRPAPGHRDDRAKLALVEAGVPVGIIPTVDAGHRLAGIAEREKRQRQLVLVSTVAAIHRQEPGRPADADPRQRGAPGKRVRDALSRTSRQLQPHACVERQVRPGTDPIVHIEREVADRPVRIEQRQRRHPEPSGDPCDELRNRRRREDVRGRRDAGQDGTGLESMTPNFGRRELELDLGPRGAHVLDRLRHDAVGHPIHGDLRQVARIRCHTRVLDGHCCAQTRAGLRLMLPRRLQGEEQVALRDGGAEKPQGRVRMLRALGASEQPHLRTVSQVRDEVPLHGGDVRGERSGPVALALAHPERVGRDEQARAWRHRAAGTAPQRPSRYPAARIDGASPSFSETIPGAVNETSNAPRERGPGRRGTSVTVEPGDATSGVAPPVETITASNASRSGNVATDCLLMGLSRSLRPPR